METTETIKPVAPQIKDCAQHLFHDSKEALGNMKRMVGERSKQAMDMTDECVHENVWKAILASAAVGLLVGLVMRRD
jgi:ElaB/YqjD/DUF883 family membrane-anchored ribosome-binding protein